MKKGLKVVSLFDGISCGRIALERAGFSVAEYYACEIKPEAIKVTMFNYPDTKQLGDVRNVDFASVVGGGGVICLLVEALAKIYHKHIKNALD